MTEKNLFRGGNSFWSGNYTYSRQTNLFLIQIIKYLRQANFFLSPSLDHSREG